jgi:hypothetical protein
MRWTRLQHSRTQSGFALVATLSLGLACIALMIALLPLLLTATRSETALRKGSDLRAAAESGIDYAISQLNVNKPGQCPIDNKITVVTPNLLTGFKDTEIVVKIKTLSATDIDWSKFRSFSAIYAPSLDSSITVNNLSPTAKSYDDVPRSRIGNADYWRVIESTASSNGFTQSIRVFAEPIFAGTDVLDSKPEYPNSDSTTAAYFSKPFFGNSLVTIDGPSKITTTAGKLTIQSNKKVEVGANTEIDGDLVVSNNSIDAPKVAVGQPTTKVNGQLRTNGDLVSGFKGTAGPSPLPGDNVLDLANRPSTSNPIDTSSVQQQSIAATPPSNVNAPSLTAALLADKTLAGPYSTSNANLSDSKPLVINNPVQLFINDAPNGTTDDALNFDSSIIKNNLSANDLTIWYSGTKSLRVNLSQPFKGLIYAPNGRIIVTGSSNFQGGLVGDAVVLNNTGQVTIDAASQNPNSSYSWLTAPMINSNINGVTALNPIGYKAVTWQEFPRKIF